MDSSGSHLDSVWTCPFVVGGRLGSRESFDRSLEWIRIGSSLLMVWVLREHLAALVIQRSASSNNRNDDGTSRSTGEDRESPLSFLVFQTSLLKSTKSRVYFLYVSFHTVLGKDSE